MRSCKSGLPAVPPIKSIKASFPLFELEFIEAKTKLILLIMLLGLCSSMTVDDLDHLA